MEPNEYTETLTGTKYLLKPDSPEMNIGALIRIHNSTRFRRQRAYVLEDYTFAKRFSSHCSTTGRIKNTSVLG